MSFTDTNFLQISLCERLLPGERLRVSGGEGLWYKENPPLIRRQAATFSRGRRLTQSVIKQKFEAVKSPLNCNPPTLTSPRKYDNINSRGKNLKKIPKKCNRPEFFTTYRVRGEENAILHPDRASNTRGRRRAWKTQK